MDSQMESLLKGSAACTAIKKNYPLLHKAVTIGDIPMTLYSNDMIEERTFEQIATPGSSDTDNGHAILKDVKKIVGIDPSCIELFCKILSKEKRAEEVASALHVSFEEILAEERKKLQSLNKSGCKEFEELKEELVTYRKASMRPEPPVGHEEWVKKAVYHYIETSIEAGSTSETLNDHVRSLCEKELLISSDIYKWALQQIINVSNQKSTGTKRMELATLRNPTEDAPTISLSPETLYHASLCSHAVNSCSKTSEVHGFLRQSGHNLKEASLSPQTETMDQYLIAKNGNTIYVAFQSKLTVTQWKKKHCSFEEGLDEQTQKIPLRFFMEQILKQQKIVFTGFSFGGMLACCVTANLWREPTSSLNTALLRKNVTCITFGQPLGCIPYVQETIQNFPILNDTIHRVLEKEDIVPRLFHCYEIGCRIKHSVTKSIPSPSDESDKLMDFGGSFSAPFLSYLATLQKLQPKPASYSGALQSATGDVTTESVAAPSLRHLKKLLQELVSKISSLENLDDPLFGRLYLMHQDSSKGVQWQGEVDKDTVAKELLQLDKAFLETVDLYLFKRHTMKNYQGNILKSYLQKPSVGLPTQPNAKIEEVSLLKPIALSVEFHLYRDEHVIVLEGNNLWFCHKICLGEKKNTIVIDSPGNIMRRSIQFKFRPSKKTENIVVDSGVNVVLHSHFTEPYHKRVQAKKEPCYFSLRQIQLAKHTPTEVIQLAYCVAMLERSCNPTTCLDQPLVSSRFEKVKEFLEDVAKIVPLESVFYAIAYGDKETALTCGKALQDTDMTLPLSQMMVVGAKRAAERVKSGMTEEECTDKIRQQRMGLTVEMPNMLDFSLGMAQYAESARSNLGGGTANTRRATRESAAADPLGRHTRDRVRTPNLGRGMAGTLGAKGTTRRGRESAATNQSAFLARQSREQVQPGSGIPVQVPHPSVSFRRSLSPSQQEAIPILPVPFPVAALAALPSVPLDYDLAIYLETLAMKLRTKAFQYAQAASLPVISKRTIEHFCPFSTTRSPMTNTKLQSPIQALKQARDSLIELVAKSSEPDMMVDDTTLAVNTNMLRVVRDIRDCNLKTCASLLAAFMEQQIRIPMLKTNIDTARVLSATQAPVAMGAWAFISMGYEEIMRTMLSSEGSSLLIEIEDYITGILETSSDTPKEKHKKSKKRHPDQSYAAKLAFLVGGIKTSRTVTSSTQYISYSLEHQLHKLSEQLKPQLDKSCSVKSLVDEWDRLFKDNALSLVHKSHRLLIARWLKWALNIYDLRETLAKYTCLGVIGLSNSGKSLLVNTLFKLQTQVGTTESKRTVVPFLYNMDGKVDNLDIIDFPGVDDKDSIPDLAALLVGLAQVVIFVLDYRRVNSEAASVWLKKLAEEDIDIQVLVCLTHADHLYMELKKKPESTNQATITHRLKGELANVVDKLGRHPSRTVNYYCFNLPEDSDLTFETLKEVEIYSPEDAGAWLVHTLEDKLDQQDLATKLDTFLKDK